MAKTDLTAERLRELLNYDPETGVFIRLCDYGTAKTGDVAGGIDHGYIQISVLGEKHFAHRLAWLYIHAVFPANFLDHINGIRSDNRICNLREATHSENSQNQALNRRNTSGFQGVCQDKRDGKYTARVTHHGKTFSFGYHDTPELANAAQIAGKAKLHAFNPVAR